MKKETWMCDLCGKIIDDESQAYHVKGPGGEGDFCAHCGKGVGHIADMLFGSRNVFLKYPSKGNGWELTILEEQ